MSYRKSTFDIAQLRRAGRVAALVVDDLGRRVQPGVSAAELDARAWELCREHGVEPAFFGHDGYAYASCIAVNDEVLHAIPHASKVFAEGDLVKVDFGAQYRGYYSDHCRTFVAGRVRNEEDAALLAAGEAATANAVGLVAAGQHMGTVSHAMEATAEAAGFSVVRKYIGHGIGKHLHEMPEVPAFGKPGTGIVLEPNMVLCVECQVCAGSPDLVQDRDGWTMRTRDGRRSVMFETMVLVTQDGAEVLSSYE